MADTHRLALITQSLSKDDRSDAQRLAELGLRMPEMLNAVEPCSLGIQSDRAVLKARETLVETRTKLINTVRGTVKSFGERLPASSSEAFVKKARPQIPAQLRDALEPLLQVIQHVSVEIRCFDKRIEKLGAEKYPATKRLRSIRGVGAGHRAGVRAEPGQRPATAAAQPGRRSPHGTTAEAARLRRALASAEHYQKRRPFVAATAGAMLAIHSGASRGRLAVAALGTGFGGAGRPQREAQSDRGGGAQTGRAHARAVAPGCGLRAVLRDEPASGRRALRNAARFVARSRGKESWRPGKRSGDGSI